MKDCTPIHAASFLYAFYCIAILKNPLNVLWILDFDNLKAKKAIASGVLQQINILYFLKSCTHHTSCFNNIYILLVSFKNSSNVLHTLDYDTSKTKQPIASGELCPQTPCFRDPLLGLPSSLMIVYPPFGLDWLIRQYFTPLKCSQTSHILATIY